MDFEKQILKNMERAKDINPWFHINDGVYQEDIVGDCIGLVICNKGGYTLHPTAYVGFPYTEENKVLIYDEEYHFPIGVHGGVTYGRRGAPRDLYEDHYFYGWDYNHLGDWAIYDINGENGRIHKPDDVVSEMRRALEDVVVLVDIIKNKDNSCCNKHMYEVLKRQESVYSVFECFQRNQKTGEILFDGCPYRLEKMVMEENQGLMI